MQTLLMTPPKSEPTDSENRMKLWRKVHLLRPSDLNNLINYENISPM